MYDSNNYANQEEIEENRRNPKNRFLGLFCHASDVDDHWGFNWSFKCGVCVFSILVGIWTIFDISTMAYIINRSYLNSWFTFFFFFRFVSDFIAIVGIIFAFCSITQSHFNKATTAYYLLVGSFALNTAFIVYCIVSVFNRYFWRTTTYRFIIWLLNEFVLLIFTWILFCNMVDIGRRNRNAMASNPF